MEIALKYVTFWNNSTRRKKIRKGCIGHWSWKGSNVEVVWKKIGKMSQTCKFEKLLVNTVRLRSTWKSFFVMLKSTTSSNRTPKCDREFATSVRTASDVWEHHAVKENIFHCTSNNRPQVHVRQNIFRIFVHLSSRRTYTFVTSVAHAPHGLRTHLKSVTSSGWHNCSWSVGTFSWIFAPRINNIFITRNERTKEGSVDNRWVQIIVSVDFLCGVVKRTSPRFRDMVFSRRELGYWSGHSGRVRQTWSESRHRGEKRWETGGNSSTLLQGGSPREGCVCRWAQSVIEQKKNNKMSEKLKPIQRYSVITAGSCAT